MIDLDNIDEIKKLDKSDVYGSVVALPKQCEHAWEDTKDMVVPIDYKNINNIVMAGMGGSGLAARVIEGVYGLKLPCPLIRINDYDLPAWVNEKTLVICSAFSGTTEEPLEILRQALEKKAKVMTIGAGATIIEIAQKEKIPYYKINPVYNPSKNGRGLFSGWTTRDGVKNRSNLHY